MTLRLFPAARGRVIAPWQWKGMRLILPAAPALKSLSRGWRDLPR